MNFRGDEGARPRRCRATTTGSCSTCSRPPPPTARWSTRTPRTSTWSAARASAGRRRRRRSPLEALGPAAARTTSRPRRSARVAFLAAARRRRASTPCTSPTPTRCGLLEQARERYPRDLDRDLPALPHARHRLRRSAPTARSTRRCAPRRIARRCGRRSPPDLVDTIGSDHVPRHRPLQGAAAGEGLGRLPGAADPAAARAHRGSSAARHRARAHRRPGVHAAGRAVRPGRAQGGDPAGRGRRPRGRRPRGAIAHRGGHAAQRRRLHALGGSPRGRHDPRHARARGVRLQGRQHRAGDARPVPRAPPSGAGAPGAAR